MLLPSEPHSLHTTIQAWHKGFDMYPFASPKRTLGAAELSVKKRANPPAEAKRRQTTQRNARSRTPSGRAGSFDGPGGTPFRHPGGPEMRNLTFPAPSETASTTSSTNRCAQAPRRPASRSTASVLRGKAVKWSRSSRRPFPFPSLPTLVFGAWRNIVV